MNVSSDVKLNNILDRVGKTGVRSIRARLVFFKPWSETQVHIQVVGGIFHSLFAEKFFNILDFISKKPEISTKIFLHKKYLKILPQKISGYIVAVTH